MNFKTATNALLLGVMCSLVSCLGDDEQYVDYSQYNDVAIKDITFGTLTRTMHALDVNGKDSVYEKTFDASAYAIRVDNVQDSIYNDIDSLPKGTQLNSVALNITASNSAIVTVVGADGNYRALASSDTIDCTTKRKLRCFSANGEAYRDYVLTLVTHDQEPDSLQWGVPTVVSEVAQMKNMKLYAVGNRMFATGMVNGSLAVCTTTTSGAQQWEPMASVPEVNGDYTIVTDKQTLYLLDEQAHKLHTTTDALQWTTYSGAQIAELKHIVAALQGTVYGISNDADILSATSDYNTWTAELVDDSPYKYLGGNVKEERAKYLPTENFAACVKEMRFNKGVYNIIFAGERKLVYKDQQGNDSIVRDMTFWNCEKDTKSSAKGSWGYVARDKNKRYDLPVLSNLSLATYNNNIVATGAETDTYGDQRYENVFNSIDNGLTWKTNGLLTMPQLVIEGEVSMATDNENHVWIARSATGEVWRGYINKLVW